MRVEQLGETLLEKGSPPDPFPKPFIAFSAFGDASPNNEKVVRVYKRVQRKFFSEELTQLCTKYAPINSDLPRFAQHGSTLVPLSQSESPERHESRCLLKPICDGQARRRGGKLGFVKIETKSPRQLIPWEVRSYSALCCDAAGGFLIHTKLFALSFATFF